MEKFVFNLDNVVMPTKAMPKKTKKNNYCVQVTDKYYSSGYAVELHENLTKEAAIALYKQCERAYPREAYRVIWGSND